ncbi:MBL fold metallo-hydrolase [Neisseria animaloris]|uniref:Probable L-ascorbate-6-phosphate lactonase ulaG n=1 Tax=Neisseria animaloris TaxID=326522 RepID=A0A448UAQ1_9NEIS|nr:MBL fold metallo-hydrolase [Neisseria animaloris]VEJ20962.1 Probable L-ascorbate-6-phosphate lactonase ulaG [Neisseria animaloris]
MKLKHHTSAVLSYLGSAAFLRPGRRPVYPAGDHYCPTKKKFFNTPPIGAMDLKGVLSAQWEIMFNRSKLAPPSPLPMMKPDWQAFLAPDSDGKFIWFGHSTLMMRLNNQTILIDPVFSDYASPVPAFIKRFQPPPAGWEELPPIDTVVYSHDHYDHFDKDAVRHFADKPVQFIVPLGFGVLLRKYGIRSERIHELDWWQSLEYHGVKYHAVPARHYSGRSLFDRNRSLWAGWVFQTSTGQIYYSGDSSYPGHFAEIGKHFGGFDIAFIENGQYNTAWTDNHMMPEQTAQAAREVKTKRFVPVHWGAYALSIHAWNDPVCRSVPLVKQYGIEPLTPVLGQVFDQNTVTREWWLEVR